MASELRPHPHPVPDARPSPHARLAVLGATATTIIVLLVLGYNLPAAAVGTLTAAAGGVEICTRLTEPYPAPWLRVAGLVVILVLVVVVLCAGYAPATSAAVALAIAGFSAEAARRLIGQPSRELRHSH